MKKFIVFLILKITFSANLFTQIPSYSVTMSPLDYELLYTRSIWSNVFLKAPFSSFDTNYIWDAAEIRFKGHSTRYYPKKSYRGRFATNQLFRGLRAVNYNAMYTDKSFMREKLCWDLFADLRAVAPFCYHVKFSINNESKGLFAFIDKVDRYFLLNRGFTLSNLYEANDDYYSSDLTIQPDSLLMLYYNKEVGTAGDYSDLKSLIYTLNTVSDANFAATVIQLFDTLSVLNWFVVNTITMMGDSYNKNYLLFRDSTRQSQQWIVIPWDYDLSWGRNGDFSIPFPSSLLNDCFVYTFPPLSGPSNVLKDRWMANPILKDMFKRRLRYALDSIFTETRYHKKIDSLKTLIEKEVIYDRYKWGTTQDFYEHVEALKYYVTVRRNYLYKTFINPPSGQYNIVTLPIQQTNVPYHFITYDGRTIATMWFSSINNLDSIQIRVYPDSTPPFVNNASEERFIKRWLKITPYPSNAQFTAKLQFMYEDVLSDYREVGTGVQDERLLRAGYFRGSFYQSLPTQVNSYANTVIIEQIDQTQVGSERYITAMISETYTQKWFKQPNYFWQRLYDVKFSNRQNGYAVGEQGIFLRSSNGGTSWIERFIGINLPFFDFVNPKNNLLFAVGEFGSIYKSADNGESWLKVQINTKRNIRAIDFNNEGNGVVVGDKGMVAFTSDSGKIWNILNLDATKDFFDVTSFDDGQYVLVGSDGSVYFSLDSLNVWELRNQGINKNFYALKVFDNSELFVVGDSGSVFSTNDRGYTWCDISIPEKIKLFDLYVLNTNSIFATGEGGKIYFTNDKGANWFSQYTATSHDLNAICFVDSTYGIAVGNDGVVLRTTEAGTLTRFEEASIHFTGSYKLFQNYPNPFNATTTITYKLPPMPEVYNRVTLKIFDLLGRQVKTLVDDVQKRGSYKVVFDASGLASGVYFYKLEADNKFVDIKKLLLLK